MQNEKKVFVQYIVWLRYHRHYVIYTKNPNIIYGAVESIWFENRGSVPGPKRSTKGGA